MAKDSRGRWHILYYSHMYNGKHYCFDKQSVKSEYSSVWKDVYKYNDNPLLPENT